MVRISARMGLGLAGLLAGAGAPLAAQSLWLPASDPAGIARAGAGVAFGQSLEAAALNPALLVTLRDDGGAYLAGGMEMQASQATLAANQTVLESNDRNRFLGALGAAWKITPGFYLGLKADSPFMRHARMPLDYSGRFEAQSLDLTTRRVELQGSWALSPNWSVGVSVGATRVQYAFSNRVRVPVPTDGALPAGTGNPTGGLLEVGVAQEGSKVLPSYALGFRYAINPRWTVAGAWQGPVKGTLGLSSRLEAGQSMLVGKTGYGAPDQVALTAAPTVLAALTTAPGGGDLQLPARTALGIRHRVNQTFTWEADLRYIQGASLRLPGRASVTGPSGTVTGAAGGGGAHSGYGLSLAGEMALTKRLTGRLGLAVDPGLREDPVLEPTLGGAKSASFAAGVVWRAWGGELSLSWMIRQSQDRDVNRLDYAWGQDGPAATGSLYRVENMGHLWSVGFKKAF